MKTSPTPGCIFWATVITITIGIFIATGVHDGKKTESGTWVVTALAGCFGYILFARIVAGVLNTLADSIDKVYNLTGDNQWGNWTGDTSLGAGVFWPITVIAIPIYIVALVFGVIFRSLWK